MAALATRVQILSMLVEGFFAALDLLRRWRMRLRTAARGFIALKLRNNLLCDRLNIFLASRTLPR
jgi:hypothetical protein